MIELALIIKIFFLLNPFASFSVLSAAHRKGMDVKSISIQAVLFAFAVAVIFVFAGPFILKGFGIGMDAFRAGGGIVVILLGINMTKERASRDVTKEDSIVSLIATPLLTGPATLSFLMLNVAGIGIVPLLLNMVLAFMLTGSLFIFFAVSIKRIKPRYMTFIGRLLGLFIIGLGVEMLAMGVKGILA